ncbi:MAG: hypothetical protein JSW65_00025, partial [Candidatus Bipolaricaulota bacterium]
MKRFAAATVLLCLLGTLSAAAATDTERDCTIPDLTGRWAFAQVMVAVLQVPLAGEVELTTRVALLVDIEQVDRRLVLRDHYCFADTFADPEVMRTEITDGFIQSIRPQPRTAELRCEDGILRFVQTEYLELRGTSLEDPSADPLPTDPDDPRVFDADADGRPGLTIPIEVLGLIQGETYVVQRVRYVLQGKVTSTDAILGAIDWSSEQSILAASTPLLSIPLVEWRHPDESRHWFAMERVDAEW